jgi:hypothetical protein
MLTLLARVLARRLHLAELLVQPFSETVARMENLVVEGRLYERFGTNVRIDSPSGRRSSGWVGPASPRRTVRAAGIGLMWGLAPYPEGDPA